MHRLKRNIAANLLGTGWTTMLSLVLVPVYIRFLGIESYGLIGIYATLLAVFSLLDLGLSTTLNRELARLSTEEDAEQTARDLVRTIEIVYWGAALGIAIIMTVAAPVIATHWIHAQHLSESTVQQAIRALGYSIALQFPFALYSGGLLGLQRQVELNVVTATITTARSVGVILILWLVSPTVQAFFYWQTALIALQTFVTAVLLWRALPPAWERARFRKQAFLSIWRFAAGMTGIAVLSLIVGQMDKLVLSTLLPLTLFGYYVLATNVASQLYSVVYPIFSAVFPRFTQLVSSGDEDALVVLYHHTSQLLSVAVLPMATILALFAPLVLSLWTRDPAVVQNASTVTVLLVVGTALNSLMNIPYALMLAEGWTALPLYQNLVAAVLMLPMLLWATSHFGTAGAASVWIVMNGGYVLIGIPILHRRFLKREKWHWYLNDVLLPLVSALCVAGLGRWLIPRQLSAPKELAWLAAISASTLAVTVLTTPVTRGWVLMLVSKLFRAAGSGRSAPRPAEARAMEAGYVRAQQRGAPAQAQYSWLMWDNTLVRLEAVPKTGPLGDIYSTAKTIADITEQETLVYLPAIKLDSRRTATKRGTRAPAPPPGSRLKDYRGERRRAGAYDDDE